MSLIHSPAYQRAMIAYLRKGTPIALSLKMSEQQSEQTHPTTHYIWRTSGDSKVRASHAANNGRIFAWDNPPATGHPGEDYGCRCKAEPYYGRISTINDPPIESVYPELILVPLLGVGSRAVSVARVALRQIQKNSQLEKSDKFTEHGAIRSAQRRISDKEAQEAISNAKETGNVFEKIGKYGTRQIHYKGENGITVIIETEGRNAGKIITFWRH